MDGSEITLVPLLGKEWEAGRVTWATEIRLINLATAAGAGGGDDEGDCHGQSPFPNRPPSAVVKTHYYLISTTSI